MIFLAEGLDICAYFNCYYCDEY